MTSPSEATNLPASNSWAGFGLSGGVYPGMVAAAEATPRTCILPRLLTPGAATLSPVVVKSPSTGSTPSATTEAVQLPPTLSIFRSAPRASPVTGSYPPMISELVTLPATLTLSMSNKLPRDAPVMLPLTLTLLMPRAVQIVPFRSPLRLTLSARPPTVTLPFRSPSMEIFFRLPSTVTSASRLPFLIAN